MKQSNEGAGSVIGQYHSGGKAVLLRQNGQYEPRNKENQRTYTEQQKKSSLGSGIARHLSFFEKDFSLVNRQQSALQFEDTINIQRDLRREFSREGVSRKEPEKQAHEENSAKSGYHKGSQRSNSFYNNSSLYQNYTNF